MIEYVKYLVKYKRLFVQLYTNGRWLRKFSKNILFQIFLQVVYYVAIKNLL